MLNIDLTNVEEQSGDLPAGEYIATVSKAELKDTSTGGQMIATEFTINGPVQANRKAWFNFNIKNANPKAVEIGLSQLKTMIVKSGKNIGTLNDLNLLYGLQVGIVVKPQKSNDPRFDGKTGVVGFKEAKEVKALAPTPQGINVASTDIPF